MANIFDQAMLRLLDRPAIKAKLVPQAPPGYIRTEVGQVDDDAIDLDDYLLGMSEEQQEKVALSISWIYSSIDLLARKVFSSDLFVAKKSNKERVDTHPFYDLLEKPNEFMGLSFLLRHLVFSLTLSKQGAFWFLSPERGTDELVELWPINPGRVKPKLDRQNYVKYFYYEPKVADGKERRAYKIDPKYVVWFRYADIHNYWASLPPLRALLDAMSIELGINDSQRKFYTEGRGIPLSIVSVSPEIDESDYAAFREDLHRDWKAEGTTLAIARGGTLDVKALGFTQKDLEILGNQELTRDKLDTVIFGIPLRGSGIGRGDGLKQADKFINDNTVFPLHKMIKEEVTAQAIRRHYDDEHIAMFDDIRATDRALTIQEDTINSRWRTINEQRIKQGLPELAGIMKDLGDWLIPLANNPGLAGQYLGIDINEGHIAALDDVGNLTESQDPEALTEQLVGEGAAIGPTETKSAAVLQEATNLELKRWRTVAKRSLKQFGSAIDRPFITDIIPEDAVKNIRAELCVVETPGEISSIFERYIT